MDTKAESIANSIIEQFEEATSGKGMTLTTEKADEMVDKIGDIENFKACLPVFRDKALDYKNAIDLYDEQTKRSQDEKKIWKTRLDTFLNEFLGRALQHYGGGEKSLKGDDGVKISSTTRDNLVVDDEKLIALWQPIISSIQASLPPYVKVTASIDKKALTEFCKTEEDLFATRPDIVSTVSKTSTNIK